MTLPADALHLDSSDLSADDKICEDDEEEDAHTESSSNVVSISEIEADIFTCNEQLHETEIGPERARIDSESESLPHKQTFIETNDEPSDSETNALSSTPERHCKSVMGLSTQTDTKGHAQPSSHSDSDSSTTQASQRTDKRYRNKTHLISGSYSSKTTSTPVAARILKTRMGKSCQAIWRKR